MGPLNEDKRKVTSVKHKPFGIVLPGRLITVRDLHHNISQKQAYIN